MLPATVLVDVFCRQRETLKTCHLLAATNKECWEALKERRETIYRRFIAQSWPIPVPDNLEFTALTGVLECLVKGEVRNSFVASNDVSVFYAAIEYKIIPLKPDGTMATPYLAGYMKTIALHDCEKIFVILKDYYPKSHDNAIKGLHLVGLNDEAVLTTLRSKAASRCLKLWTKPVGRPEAYWLRDAHTHAPIVSSIMGRWRSKVYCDVHHYYWEGRFKDLTDLVLLPFRELCVVLNKQRHINNVSRLLDLFLTPHSLLELGEEEKEWPPAYVAMINNTIVRLVDVDNYKDYYWKLLYLSALNSTILQSLQRRFPTAFTLARVQRALPAFFQSGVKLAMESCVFTQLTEGHQFDLRMLIARFLRGLVQQGLAELPWLKDLLSRVDP